MYHNIIIILLLLLLLLLLSSLMLLLLLSLLLYLLLLILLLLSLLLILLLLLLFIYNLFLRKEFLWRRLLFVHVTLGQLSTHSQLNIITNLRSTPSILEPLFYHHHHPQHHHHRRRRRSRRHHHHQSSSVNRNICFVQITLERNCKLLFHDDNIFIFPLGRFSWI